MVKHLTRCCSVILLLLAMLIFGTLGWLHDAVRSLEWARPHIEAALNPANAPYKITYSEANLDWRDWSNFGLLEIKDVRIGNREGEAHTFAKFPAVYISLSPLGLLSGHVLQTIQLDHPRMFLTRDAQKVVRLGLEDSDTSVALSDVLDLHNDNQSADQKFDLRGSLPFRRLVIRHAALRFSDSVTNTTISSNDSNFDLARNHGNVDAVIDAPFMYNDVPGRINASLRSSHFSDAHIVTAALTQVPAELGCLIFSCPTGMKVSGMVNGKMVIGLNDDAKPMMAELNLTTQNASFTDPALFPETLKSTKGLIEMQASDDMKKVRLSRFSLGLEDTGFEITGSATHDSEGWTVDANGRATRPMSVTKLYKYWPLTLSPQSREWVMGSMQTGEGSNMTMKLHMTPPDWDKPELPDKAIDAHVEASDITSEYIKGFPLLHHVHGQVHFTGETVRINADAGSMLTGTQLKSAMVYFPDLNKTGTPVQTTTTLQTTGPDAATLLGLKYFPFAKALQLDPATISGAIDTTLSLKFDAFPQETVAAATDKKKNPDDVDFSQVGYDISAKLHNIAQPKFAGRINLQAVNGDVSANNDGFHINGTAQLGTPTPAQFTVTQKSGEDVKVGLNGRVGRDAFASAGIDLSRIGEGTADANAELLIKKNTVVVKKADLDVKDLECSIPELSWKKKRGTAGKVSVQSDGTRYQLAINSDDLNIKGQAQMNADGEVISADFPTITTQKDDFSLRYATKGEGYEVSVKGARLDASDSYSKSENSALTEFPAIKLNIDLGSFILVPEDPFTALKGNLQCDKIRCNSASFSAKLGKGNVVGGITSPGGVRQLKLNASDAGEFLRAVNLTDRVHGGTLDLHGTYDDRTNTPIFNGHGLITECVIKNSAILGRIFSIASLSGIQNALTGSGIVFNRIAADISESAGVITVKNGRANGNATGLTVAGTVDTTDAGLNLKGVVVPAYAINSLLGKIPLIGALAGGEGEGLIAFNYSITGTYNDPKVGVNPLSGLTPGFLRGIFHIFDSDDKKPAKQADKPAADADEEPSE